MFAQTWPATSRHRFVSLSLPLSLYISPTSYESDFFSLCAFHYEPFDRASGCLRLVTCVRFFLAQNCRNIRNNSIRHRAQRIVFRPSSCVRAEPSAWIVIIITITSKPRLVAWVCFVCVQVSAHVCVRMVCVLCVCAELLSPTQWCEIHLRP